MASLPYWHRAPQARRMWPLEKDGIEDTGPARPAILRGRWANSLFGYRLVRLFFHPTHASPRHPILTSMAFFELRTKVGHSIPECLLKAGDRWLVLSIVTGTRGKPSVAHLTQYPWFHEAKDRIHRRGIGRDHSATIEPHREPAAVCTSSARKTYCSAVTLENRSRPFRFRNPFDPSPLKCITQIRIIGSPTPAG